MSLIPQHPPFASLPRAIHVREALRTMRHVAKQGRNNVAQAAAIAGSPVTDMAAFALSRADRVAAIVENVAEGMAGRILGDPSDRAFPAAGFSRGQEGADQFAADGYVVLRQMLQQLGLRDCFVSELKLRDAFLSVHEPDDLRRAAALCVAMRRLNVVRQGGPSGLSQSRPHMHAADQQTLAFFALMLFLLSASEGRTADDAAHSAVMLALALDGDIVGAGDDLEAIAALLDEFRHHV